MFLKLYAIALPVFLTIDALWLGIVARNFYSKHIGFLLKTNIDWVSALLFYFIFIAGLIVFVIMPGLAKGSLVNTLLLGALFGLVTYATYDLTNQATIKDWPLIVTLADLMWGMAVSVLTAGVTFIIVKKLGL